MHTRVYTLRGVEFLHKNLTLGNENKIFASLAQSVFSINILFWGWTGARSVDGEIEVYIIGTRARGNIVNISTKASHAKLTPNGEGVQNP